MFYTQADRDRDEGIAALLFSLSRAVNTLSDEVRALASVTRTASSPDPTEYDPPPRVDEADEMQAQRAGEKG